MENDKLVERLFQNSIAAKIDCVEVVTPTIVCAGQLLAECLLSDHKVLVCGQGSASLNAEFFVSCLMNQGERERPALPAILLDNHGARWAASDHDFNEGDILARQIQALGQPGDVLVVFSRTGTAPAILNAIRAAHERSLAIVALTAHEGGNIPALLDHRDVEVRIPLTARFRIYEMYLLLSFALCELIEWQLFGGE
jgi:D-sedoheptulose 7-phosphate isomerase